MGPLQGIKILDLSRLLPGPFCTMVLGDLGAEVIKIEQPGKVDPSRLLPPLIEGMSARYLILNRNKKSIAIDLKAAKGREIFIRMIKGADVLLETFRPGVMERLGLGYEKVKSINPELIYCSLSGYGQDGPYRLTAGHDINYLSLGGLLGITGEKGGPPVMPGIPVSDLAAGPLYSAIAILCAVIARGKTGRGQRLDVSMLDSIVSLMIEPGAQYFGRGSCDNRGEGRASGGIPHYNVYETKDGQYISIGAFEKRFWANFCDRVGRPDMREMDYLKPGAHEAVRDFLKETFLAKSRDEWVAQFSDVDACITPVNSMAEVFSDPQVLHRKMVVETEHPVAGTIKQMGIPIKLSDTPGEIRLPAPRLGEQTEEVMLALGYSEGEIRSLEDEKIIQIGEVELN